MQAHPGDEDGHMGTFEEASAAAVAVAAALATAFWLLS